MKALNYIEDLIQRANIMPIVALITIPHLYEVLSGHGENIIVPAVISIFVDLTHYRAVLVASYKGRLWWIIAIITTVATFGFQWNFYHSESILINRFLFSSVVPVGIVFMTILDGQKVVTNARKIAETKINEYARKAMKQNEKQEQVIARLTQENESIVQRLASLAQEMESLESDIKAKDNQVKVLKGKLKDADSIMKAYNVLNPLVKDIAKSKAGLLNVTQAQLAEKHGTNETKVSRLSSQVNGHIKEGIIGG